MQTHVYFQLTWTLTIALTSLWLARRHPTRFFVHWTIGYLFFFATAALEVVSMHLGRLWGLLALAVLSMASAGYFFLKVVEDLNQRPPRRGFTAGPPALSVLASAAAVGAGGNYVAALVPQILLSAFCLISVGLALLRQRSARVRTAALWLPYSLLAKGGWFFAYPLMARTRLEPFAYWVDGTLQIVIGLGMIVYLLERSTQELRRLIDASPRHALYLLDAEGRVLEWNISAQRLCGFSAREVLGKHYTWLHVLEAGESGEDKLAGQALELHRWHRRQGAEPFWAHSVLSPIEETPGEVAAYAILTLDITERVKLEAERDRLARAVEQSAEGILIADAAGQVRYANPAFLRQRGVGLDGILAKPLTATVPPEAQEPITEALAKGQPWTGRLANKEANKAQLEDVTLSPLRNAEGRVTDVVMLRRDVTREVELQEQLRHAQKMEVVGRFASGIAHDFGNLLAIIEGHNHLLRTGPLVPREINRCARAIGRAAERGGILIRSLLVFGHNGVASPVSLDLNRIVEESVELLKRVLDQKTELRTILPDRPVYVLSSRTQLEHVIFNLATNACDAMPSGGELTFTVGTGTGPRQTLAVLEVRDTGTGMDAATRQHLFEPFFTTKPVGKGTGLGLSTVASIVRDSGGFIEVESTPGQGSTFRIFIPAHSPAEERPKRSPSSRRGRRTTSERGR